MDTFPPVVPDDEHRFWRHNFDKRLDALETRIDGSFKDLKESIEDLRDAAVKGFPEDDPIGHRRVHEAYIRKAKLREKRTEEIITNLIKGVVMATLLFIATASWNHFKSFL